jgi:lanosterol synthase
MTIKETIGSTTGANAKSLPTERELRKRNAETTGDVTEAKRHKIADSTDRTRWRMRDDESRHTWHYLEDDEAVKAWPQSLADKYYLGLPLVHQPYLRTCTSSNC